MHYYVVKIVPWINLAMNQQAKWAWFNTAFSKLSQNNYDGDVVHSQRAGSHCRNRWSTRTVYSWLSWFKAKQEWVINSLIQRGNVWSIPLSVSWLKSTSQEQTWENLKPKKGHGINNPFKMLHRIPTAGHSQSRQWIYLSILYHSILISGGDGMDNKSVFRA